MSISGFSSTDSDECIKLLVARDIYHMTHREATSSVNRAFAQRTDDPQEMSDRLGVVIWVLRQGLQVNRLLLNLAFIYANRLIENRDYLESFFQPGRRYETIVAEIELMRAYLRRSGVYN